MLHGSAVSWRHLGVETCSEATEASELDAVVLCRKNLRQKAEVTCLLASFQQFSLWRDCHVRQQHS